MTITYKFFERLKAIIPKEKYEEVVNTFLAPEPVTVRVNTIKITVAEAKAGLQERRIPFSAADFEEKALTLFPESPEQLHGLDLLNDGRLYRQNFSSMLPVKVLAPRPQDRVLDLCAAPGSKTTQIAALMQNSGELAAIEAVRNRYYRLKKVCELLGVTNVRSTCVDARRYRLRGEPFDRILLDAPCSSEGRFKEYKPTSTRYWSERKIREMVRKQRGLLLNATRLLKPGGVLVYATCTFAPEENEGVLDWVLRKAPGLKVLEVDLPGIPRYPALKEWRSRIYNPEVQKCFRVLPSPERSGFFIAKLTM